MPSSNERWKDIAIALLSIGCALALVGKLLPVIWRKG